MDEGAFTKSLCEERLFLVKWVRVKFRLSTDQAEDFVQDTILRAWEARERYDDQQKIRAWLMMILVNLVLSSKRRAWRTVLSDDMTVFDRGVSGGQEDYVYLRQVLQRMAKLPIDQMDAIILIARGHQYDGAGEMVDVATGTMKSRLSRGRKTLKGAIE